MTMYTPHPLVQIVPLLLSGTICATQSVLSGVTKKRSSRHSHRFQLLSMCLMMFVEVHCMCNVWLTAGLDHNLLNPQSHKIYKKRQNCFYTHWPEFYYVHVYTIIMVQLYCLYLNMYLFRRWLFLIWPPLLLNNCAASIVCLVLSPC